MIVLDIPGLLSIAARVLHCDDLSVVSLADLDSVGEIIGELEAASRSEDLTFAAATLLRGIVRHTPFPTHNRRIAVLATLCFLDLNGLDFDIEPAEALDELLDEVAGGLSAIALAENLAARVGPSSHQRHLLAEGSRAVFDRFTDNARRVVGLAHEEARLLGHTQIGTEHILLALIRFDSQRTIPALHELGASLEDARTKVIEQQGTGPGSSDSIPFTARSRKVLDPPGYESGTGSVDVDDIVLGLTRQSDSGAMRVLTEIGADVEHLRQAAQHSAQEPETVRGHRRHELSALIDENEALRQQVARLREVLHRNGIDPDL